MVFDMNQNVVVFCQWRASKVGIALLTRGDPPKSDPCEAYAPHGYFGIETQAVDTIARFINANGAHGR
jgi:hypothetical protein